MWVFRSVTTAGKQTPQVTCVSHLFCEEERLHLTQRIIWGGHWQPDTDIDIGVLVPLPSCCHFMLWEQCNGVLKCWEYAGSEKIDGKKMHYCLAWDKNQALTWGKHGSPLYLLSSAAALAVSCTANTPWFGIKLWQNGWELGAAGHVPGSWVSVTQVFTVQFQLKTRQKFYCVFLSYLNMNWI